MSPQKPMPELRPYQQTGIEGVTHMLRQFGGAILADDMGLGKTRQAIEVAASFWKEGKQIFVVCPASVRETWRTELAKCGHNDVVVLGPPSNKKYALEWANARGSMWVITSYELAEEAITRVFDSVAPRFLIMDEAHLLRGRSTKRADVVLNLARMVLYKLALTGTPMWARPRDFYKLLHILHGRNVWGSWFDFDTEFCGGKFDKFGGWDNKGLTNEAQLRDKLSRYMVRRTRGEVAAEMPVFTRQIVWVEGNEGASRAFQATMVRRQAGDMFNAVKATLDAKMPAVVELAAQAGGKFLILTWLKEHVAKLHHLLPGSIVITGDVSHAERAERIRNAAANNQGIIATIDSVGTGVDGLQHVAYVGITHAIDFVPIKLLQAEGRLNRMGQTLPVTWYYVAMSDSIDQSIVANVVEKLGQWKGTMGSDDGEALAGALGGNVNGMSDEEALRALYASLPEGDSNDTNT